jgi:hypothetical protein
VSAAATASFAGRVGVRGKSVSDTRPVRVSGPGGRGWPGEKSGSTGPRAHPGLLARPVPPFARGGRWARPSAPGRNKPATSPRLENPRSSPTFHRATQLFTAPGRASVRAVFRVPARREARPPGDRTASARLCIRRGFSPGGGKSVSATDSPPLLGSTSLDRQPLPAAPIGFPERIAAGSSPLLRLAAAEAIAPVISSPAGSVTHWCTGHRAATDATHA